MEKQLTAGFAMCGSFCTFSQVLPQVRRLHDAGFSVVPIMSQNAYSTDTRFGCAAGFVSQLSAAAGAPVWHTIAEVEPIGPKKLLDVLIVAPCTGNTLGKLAAGIADTSVTLAVKSQLRNGRPVVVAVSTNDGLAASGRSIGALQIIKNFYFVPYRQDDPAGKPASIVANMNKILQTAVHALEGRQLQPILE